MIKKIHKPIRFFLLCTAVWLDSTVWYSTLKHLDTLWNTFKHFGILWSILNTFWNIWNTLRHFETLWNIWNTLKHFETLWNTLKHFENILKHFEAFWNTLKHSETPPLPQFVLPTSLHVPEGFVTIQVGEGVLNVEFHQKLSNILMLLYTQRESSECNYLQNDSLQTRKTEMWPHSCQWFCMHNFWVTFATLTFQSHLRLIVRNMMLRVKQTKGAQQLSISIYLHSVLGCLASWHERQWISWTTVIKSQI